MNLQFKFAQPDEQDYYAYYYPNYKEEGIMFISCKDNEVSYNNINDNYYGVRAWDCVVNVTENWWGSDDGPSGDGPGSGDSVYSVYNAEIYFEPWLKKPALTWPSVFLGLLACLRARFRSLLS